MVSRSKPAWKLPTGVTRGSLDYIESAAIADGYDEDLAFGSDFQFDEEVLKQHIPQGGLVADLGCGTGRALVPLARRGNQGLAVDLSPEMLRIVRQKAEAEQLDIRCLQANLVELDMIDDQSVDHAICMFSTLGMIKGRDHRQTFLGHVRRILKPGGRFVVHVHNFWVNLNEPDGWYWVLKHYLQTWTTAGMERGDKYYRYRGIPNFFLHVYGRREFLGELRRAQFKVDKLIPLRIDRQGVLPCNWLCGGLRAGGWIASCEKEGETAAN